MFPERYVEVRKFQPFKNKEGPRALKGEPLQRQCTALSEDVRKPSAPASAQALDKIIGFVHKQLQ